jgi:hypothetical protein
MPNHPEDSRILSKPAENTEITISPSQPGAVYKSIHTTRAVRIYPIQEHELENLADLASDNTLWSSISAAALILIIERAWDWIVMPKGQEISPSAIGLMIFASLVCIYGWIKAWSARRTIRQRLTKIESELLPSS